VPTRVLGYDWVGPFEELARLPARTAVLHDPWGHALPVNTALDHWLAGRATRDVVMFLQSVDPVRDEIAVGRAVEVMAAEGAAVLFGELTEELSRKLHDDGLCLGCHYHDNQRLDLVVTRGLFRYDHLTENGISGAYGRVMRPAQPLHVDELPPGISDAGSVVRFGLRFAEASHIQPVEHAPCDSWQVAFMDAAATSARWPAAKRVMRTPTTVSSRSLPGGTPAATR